MTQTGAARSIIVMICLALSACPPAIARELPEAAPAAGASQAGELPLPSLTKCPSTNHPVLPPKWTAKALLHPFYANETLALADLTYDATVGAIYQTNEWADGRKGSWLITATATYQVTGPPEAPTGCVDMGPAFMPPGRDWLDASAQCVGVGSVQGRNAAWWKTKAGSGKTPPTTWFWYDAAKGTPWRAMFAQPAYDHGLLGVSSFINFQQFKGVSATVLPKIIAFCRTAPRKTLSLRSAADVHAADGEAVAGAEPTIVASRPKVDFKCNASPLPTFPQKFTMTTLMSSVSYKVPNPLPTRVYYDWGRQAPSMRTTMYNPDGKTLTAEALLIQGNGYLLLPTVCELVLPGIPVPNWQAVDSCTCGAAIREDPEWNQYPEQWVIQCPLESNRVFWMWYTPNGIPIVFMETGAPVDEGTSLALADYAQFLVGGPSGYFNPRPTCPKEPNLSPKHYPRLFHHAANLSGADPACHRCHEPLENR